MSQAVEKGDSWQLRAYHEENARLLLEAKRYKGTFATPNPAATGRNKELETQIAMAISMADFVPEERTEYYRGNLALVREGITGWNVQIQDVVPFEQGTLVRVRIDARHDNNGGLMTRDHLTESYLYANDQIQYLGSIKPANRGVTTYN